MILSSYPHVVNGEVGGSERSGLVLVDGDDDALEEIVVCGSVMAKQLCGAVNP